MKRSPLLYWLTALALLVGQWGMIAHAGEHALESVDDSLCVVCLQGHSLEQMQHSASVAIPLLHSKFITAVQPQPSHSSAAAQRPNIRGPPQHLQS